MVFRKEEKRAWPPGRPPLAQSVVDEYKRERCAVALAEIVCEGGVGRLTVGLLTARARVARNTFYELFDNQRDALGYACELGSRRLREAVEGADEVSGPWEERLRAALSALLGAAASDPALAELCLAHGGGKVSPAIGPYDPALVETLVVVFAQGRAEGGTPEPGSHTEELLAHGILSVIGERLRRGEVDSLAELGDQLGELVAMQFTDPAAAALEAR